jgi:hypothetical protein
MVLDCCFFFLYPNGLDWTRGLWFKTPPWLVMKYDQTFSWKMTFLCVICDLHLLLWYTRVHGDVIWKSNEVVLRFI